MRPFVYKVTLLCGLMIASSCQKETIDPNPPNPPSPIPVDTSGIDSSISLQQQTWVLDAYKIQEFGSITPVGDTLHFLTTTQYQYNGQASTYSFYPVSSSYNLTLNGTFLGNISGTIYEYNLSNGLVTGIKFNDITPGGSQQYYYLWMHKIN